MSPNKPPKKPKPPKPPKQQFSRKPDKGVLGSEDASSVQDKATKENDDQLELPF